MPWTKLYLANYVFLCGHVLLFLVSLPQTLNWFIGCFVFTCSSLCLTSDVSICMVKEHPILTWNRGIKASHTIANIGLCCLCTTFWHLYNPSSPNMKHMHLHLNEGIHIDWRLDLWWVTFMGQTWIQNYAQVRDVTAETRDNWLGYLVGSFATPTSHWIVAGISRAVAMLAEVMPVASGLTTTVQKFFGLCKCVAYSLLLCVCLTPSSSSCREDVASRFNTIRSKRPTVTAVTGTIHSPTQKCTRCWRVLVLLPDTPARTHTHTHTHTQKLPPGTYETSDYWPSVNRRLST